MQRIGYGGVPSPRCYIYNATPTPKTEGTLQMGREKACKNQRTRVPILRACLQATPTKSEQYDYLKKPCITITSINMPIRIGESSQSPTPR